MKRLLLLSVLIVSAVGITKAQVGLGNIQGTILDEATGEGIPFANVVLIQAGQQVTGASTDFDGMYKIKSVKPGSDYEVKVSTVGYSPKMKTGVVIKANQNINVNFKMGAGVMVGEVTIEAHKIPIIEKDATQGITVDGDEIRSLAGRGVASISTQAVGVADNDGAVGSVKGTRSGSTDTYIDGVKVRGSGSLPQAAYEQVSILTGGIPAAYGDVTGGVISITTKGASQVTYGGIELVTSGGIKYND
ncbi:MAG: carboxypeptidase regulatory-like domain-containing protein, partial [Flavobacteriales bacterium]